MSKNKISEWSATPANNTDVGGIDIAEGCAPSGINNAIREMMAQIKDQQAGTDGDNFTVGGNLSVTGTTTLSTALPVASGGTGATTESGARTSLGLGSIATQASSSVSITGGSITGITDLAVADGGTGASTLTANAVLIGNGTSAITSVSPGTSGNVLTSNGSAWISQALSSVTGSLGSSGYTTFQNGLTIAWGSMSTSNSGGSNNNFYVIGGSTSLPVTFTNVYQAILGFGSTGVFYGASIGVNSLTTTSLSVSGSSPYGGGNPTVNYLVIGNV